MRIVVAGATGTIGRRIGEELRRRGHEVVPLSRGLGVDVSTGAGLDTAMAGADAVVDALNIETLSGRRAAKFFTTCARQLTAAAQKVGVSRIVCVSIAGAANPQVHRLFGYYRGKAAQERAYADADVDTTTVLSTQWFELMDDVVRRASLGPVTALPTMRMAPLTAAGAAEFVVDEIEDSRAGDRCIAVKGPEEMTTLEVVRRILDARGEMSGRRPKVLRELPYLGRATANGGLIPEEATVDPTTLEEWLRQDPPR